jgi:ribosomal-protein-alanine N-acetyltransferase
MYRFDPVIREYKVGDLEKIHSIEVKSYPMPWSKTFFKVMQKANPHLFLIATLEDEVIGYIVGEVESRSSGDDVRLLGHIMNVAVKESFRRRGLGTLMMNEIEERFIEQKAKMAYLEVRESNKDAQELYSKRGYMFVTKVPRYYADEDALIMTKVLVR